MTEKNTIIKSISYNYLHIFLRIKSQITELSQVGVAHHDSIMFNYSLRSRCKSYINRCYRFDLFRSRSGSLFSTLFTFISKILYNIKY